MFAPLPPSSSVRCLCELRDALLDEPAHLRRAGERDLVDVGVIDECSTDRAIAGHDVDNARRQFGLLEDLCQDERREGRRLGGLEDAGVSRREGGRELPRRHE